MPLYTHIRNISSRNLEYINNYNIEMNYFLIQIVFYLIIGTISLVCDKEYFYKKVDKIYEEEQKKIENKQRYNNSINNIYVIEKIEEAKEKENLKQENLEEILNNGKNTEHKRRYVYGKDLIQEYGKDYFLDDEEINRIIQNSNINISNDKNKKIKDHKYRKNIEEIVISKDKEEKIADIINDGILLSNRQIILRKDISAKYVLNLCENKENTYRDNNIIIKAEENSNFEVVIIFNENKSNCKDYEK